MKDGEPAIDAFVEENGAAGISDVEHVAIGNRAGRLQRS